MPETPHPASEINPQQVSPARQAIRTISVERDVEDMASKYVEVTARNAMRAIKVATALADRGYNLHRGDLSTLITNSRVNVDVALLEDLLGIDQEDHNDE